MKNLLSPSAALALLLGLCSSALAAGGKEITVEGKGCCAKCCLKVATDCQDAVTVEKDGKKTTYFLVDNDVAKQFHDNICKGVKPVSVTGVCQKVGDQLQLTASKIELAK
jgi:hypothetical protein